jgi:hypothetical protein
MNIGVEFVRGMSLGIEFPGEGLFVIVHLGPLRLFLMNDEMAEYMEDDD